MKIAHQLKIWTACLFFSFAHLTLYSQTDSASGKVMKQLVGLRDNFIGQIEAMGYHPSLKPPEIIMDNPPSYGSYDDATNTLHTSDWNTLPDQDKAVFVKGGKTFGYSGEIYFESSAHRWIFIHELGHWWRACQHQTADPYSSEMAANRIDIAYWRETDTAYSAFSRKKFENYLKVIPDPVPPGQDKQKYLNDNYGKLPIPAYIWYQASMIVEGYYEKPIPLFKETIRKAGNK